MPVPAIAAAVGLGVGALSEAYGWDVPNYRNIPKFFEGEFDMGLEAAALAAAQDELVAKEGYRNDVYIDTRGFPTVGIGHKVVSGDNLRVGDRISDERIQFFFSLDVEGAFNAAVRQAKELDKYTIAMVASLTSVNFQLGTNWRTKFPNTWSLLKSGSVSRAINNLKQSDWAKQTPARVASFIKVLQSEFSA